MYNITSKFRVACFAIFLLSGLFLLPNQAAAQDFHYSQFYNASYNVNPALTGFFHGDERFSASIRDQWRNVPVPWFNFGIGYDRKLYPKRSKRGFFGAGVSFNYDVQGTAQLKLSNLNLSGSYSRILNHKNIITIGGLLGYANRGFDEENLTWDNHWDPDRLVVNSTRPSGESFLYERFGFLETGLGLNYRWQKSSRTKLDVGIGGWHLTTPKARFNAATDDGQDLPVRLSLYATFSKELSDKLDLQLDVLHQRQITYDELLFGGYLNFYLNENRGKEFQFRVGLGYRTRKALFPKIGIEFNNFFIAGSYDIYLTEFTREHGGGGPELHLRYIIKHVKPLGKFKACPIF